MKKFAGMILACDMDGTLLDDNKEISRKNEQAIRYFTEQGGLFSLATGRAPGAIRKYLPQLTLNAPYSLLNGSYILNTAHEPLHCAGMPMETHELIANTLIKFSQIGCEIFIGQDILICQFSEVTKSHMNFLHLDYQMVDYHHLPDTDNWCKINFTGDPEIMRGVRAFTKPYSDRFDMASSADTFWEITAPGVNKGYALRRIAKSCGIAPEHIYAVGDSLNDLAMIQTAHIGFAPNNADEDVRSAADVCVSSNNQNAVADVIEYLETYQN